MLRWNKFQLKLLQDYDVHSSLWQARRFLTTAVFTARGGSRRRQAGWEGGGGKRVARIIFPRGREKFRKNVIPKLVRDRKEGRKKTLHINVCQWCDWLIGASSNLLLGKVLKSVWIALDSYFKSKARSRCHKQIYSQAYLGYTVKNTLVVTWLLLPTKRTI